MRFSPLALLVASLTLPTGLQARVWTTEQARTDAADGYAVRATQYRLASVPADYFASLQAGEPELILPLPDGDEISFVLQPYDLLPADLAAKYPDIMTFKGQDPADPTATGRFDLGPQGFHAMFNHKGKTVFVDPLRDGDGYAIYYQQDVQGRLTEEMDEVIGDQDSTQAQKVLVDGNERKRYTIAISATAEYTQYQGGTVAAGLAAITTLLNRLNEVFERDAGAEFQLASGNDTIIFTNAGTDPFTNGSDDMNLNKQVQQNAQIQPGAKLGSFDIGHVLNTQGGGLSVVGGLCTENRSAGMTGSAKPAGDAFYIDYVAHEIGHQFGAVHSFNGTTSSCGGGNRVAGEAWEPGSGSSIMGYAGICGEENIASHSIPYFHSKSIEKMRAHMAAVASCGTRLSLSNNAPQADAGADYIIPASTPFVLRGAGSDLDRDPLLYTWEEIDLGTSSSGLASMVDDGSRPLFRFLAPTSVPERVLPSMPSLLSGSLEKGEAWPTTNRDLNFRLTVRDGKGGVASDEMRVRVVKTGKAFRLFAPTIPTPGATQIIRWEVAGTNAAPINCGKVDLAISQNGGASWTTLASDQPNSGSASIDIPAGASSTDRLRVACSNNIFFAISQPTSSGIDTESLAGDGSKGEKAFGGGGALGFWTLVLALLGWRRRSA